MKHMIASDQFVNDGCDDILLDPCKAGQADRFHEHVEDSNSASGVGRDCKKVLRHCLYIPRN